MHAPQRLDLFGYEPDLAAEDSLKALAAAGAADAALPASLPWDGSGDPLGVAGRVFGNDLVIYAWTKPGTALARLWAKVGGTPRGRGKARESQRRAAWRW